MLQSITFIGRDLKVDGGLILLNNSLQSQFAVQRFGWDGATISCRYE